jgi:hypothetical protein
MIQIDGRPEAAAGRDLPAEPQMFRKTALTKAVQMTQDFSVITQEKQGENADFGKAGDYLCIGSDGECWINKRENFEATYEPVS